MDNVERVSIKTPPTIFVADGPLLTFTLPLIPKPSFRKSGLLLLAFLLFSGFGFWSVFGAPVGWFMSLLIGEEEFQIDRFAAGLIFVCFGLLVLSPVIETGVAFAMTFFLHTPVLEIRPDGFVDRRILRRMVRWDEFESVGDRHQMFGGLGVPAEFSFKLKDWNARRFSPISALHSLFYGGKRVAVQPYGFDVPPRVILDVIVAMIRNAHAERRAE